MIDVLIFGLQTLALVFGIVAALAIGSGVLYAVAHLLYAICVAIGMVWEILWPKVRPLPGIRHVHGYIIRRKVGIRRVL